MKQAFCIAGAGSGSGKTTLTLGILAALKKRGLSVQPFKCGPDYIDPGFHKEATDTPSINLDSWMMGEETVLSSFNKAMQKASIGVIEGVMGLFDGATPTGLVGSTAHIAKLTKTPVILVIDAKGVAGTIAALIRGFIGFKEGVEIAGVIANNIGSDRHAAILREALEGANLPPLLGYLKRNPKWALPERHLGLVPDTENGKSKQWYSDLAEEIEKTIKIGEILKISTIARTLTTKTSCKSVGKVRLAYAHDEAFHFYYQENLDLLEEHGVELIPFSPLHDNELPKDCSGVMIGGGFPEMFAEQLESNSSMRTSLRKFAENDGFIYAECGGYMYLSQSIHIDDNKQHSMCEILPFSTTMNNRLRRLGYREAKTLNNSLLGPAGTTYRGHEFHWSSLTDSKKSFEPCCETIGARPPFDWKSSGCHHKNVYASYIHAHFTATPMIIENICKTLSKSTILT